MYSTTARAYIHLQTKHLSFLVLDDIVDIEIVAKKHKTSEEAMVEDVLKDLKKELFFCCLNVTKQSSDDGSEFEFELKLIARI